MLITKGKAGLLFVLASVAGWAQVNVGEQKPEASLPFTMTKVATFQLPWRVAFLPDGRMLVTEKPGPVWLVSQTGEKIQVSGTPPVYFKGQSGMHGVFLSPRYATDKSIYLTYSELGDYGGGLAMARAKLTATATQPNSKTSRCCGIRCPRGRVGRKARRLRFHPMASTCFWRLATGSA